MQLQVVIDHKKGVRQVRELNVPEGRLTIGRSVACHVCIDADHISRQHAELSISNGGFLLRDTSSNGTIAGDRVIKRSSTELAWGTPLVIGSCSILVQPLGDVEQLPSVVLENSVLEEAGLEEAGRATLPPDFRAVAVPGADVLDSSSEGDGSGELDEQGREESRKEQEPANARETFAVDVSLRKDIHRRLLEHLDLATVEATRLDDPAFRPRVLTALRRIVSMLGQRIPAEVNRDRLIGELADEALGLGPLEYLLADPEVSEIMVIDAHTIYVERSGKIELSTARFTDDERVRAVIERIVTPLGRRIDESSPLVDARLPDGSRVNAIIRPLALKGSCITIRKFAKNPLTLQNLIEFGAMTPSMGRFLSRSVVARKNVVISGGTGSGKTTLLNVLSAAIPPGERIVTIEDSAELQLEQPHVVSLETRPANMEGQGEYTIRDLVKNSLRMRPDRIVVGECRSGEALDMLQAMNTGHDGSLTTTHANSPGEALQRLETLCLMAGVELPSRAIRDQISSAVDLIIQQERLSDGSRKVTSIAEVCGMDMNGEFKVRPVYHFVRSGTSEDGDVEGAFLATGYLPSFLNEFIVRGLVKPGEPYL